MHFVDQRAALAERAARLAPGGVLLLQYHCLGAIVEGLQWNALRHGHYAYYSTPATVGMLAEVGLTATTAHRFPLYGGTVMLTAVRDGHPRPTSPRSSTARGPPPRDPAAVAGLQGSVARTAEWLRATCEAERAAGRRVYGYRAASRAVALLRVAGLDASLLTAVADASPDKHGRRMPGTDIPIIAPDELVAAQPDVVLLFVSDLADRGPRRPAPDRGGWRTLGGRRCGPLTPASQGGHGTKGTSSLSGPSRTISAVDGGISCHSPGRSIEGLGHHHPRLVGEVPEPLLRRQEQPQVVHRRADEQRVDLRAARVAHRDDLLAVAEPDGHLQRVLTAVPVPGRLDEAGHPLQRAERVPSRPKVSARKNITSESVAPSMSG